MTTFIPSPAALAFAELSLSARDTLAEQRSVYSGAESRLDWAGERWELTISTPPSRWDAAAEIEAWADRLRAGDAVARIRLDLSMPRRGTTAAATVTVSGAHTAGGRSLAVTGLGASATLLAGSLIADPDRRLHRLRASVTANGSGAATLDLFPRLRAAYSGGQAWRLAGGDGVVGNFRLQNRPGHVFAFGERGGVIGGKTLQFVEAFL